MKHVKHIFFAFVLATAIAGAQNLTPEQKQADFRFMAGQFTTYYAPLDWKKQLLNVDALDINPWLARVVQTRTDLEYYDLCVEYVASLQDTHSSYVLPSAFVARLGLGVDIYDGKVLVETIDRSLLPATDFPIAIGDELVSLDGMPAEELVGSFLKYAPQSNLRATRRMAAARITTRPQSRMPFAVNVGESAEVAIRGGNGDLRTYTIKWTKTGAPLAVGPVPNIKMSARAAAQAVDPLQEIQHSGVYGTETELGLLNYGARNPVYINGLGSSFTRRLGGAATDFFYSGSFRYEDLTIGYIRIPNYSPPSIPLALQQLDMEIAWFQANTHGLIIDEARNTGGNLCFGENIMQRLMTDKFQTTGFQLRAFWGRMVGFYNLMINAKGANAPPEVIQQYETLYKAMEAAYKSNRGVTEPIPLCASSLERDTAKNIDGASIAYTKPVMMLVDEFSTSTADSVAAMFQENNRGVLLGYRTNGAGGNNIAMTNGPFTEGSVGMTIGLQVRKTSVLREGYPFTGVIENVGVHPDIVEDYMTRENLLNGGATYVQHFLWRMAAYLR
jgi:hypothetical protein